MPRSKFKNYRSHVGDDPDTSKHKEYGRAALPIQNQGGESATENRFHPYRRHKEGKEMNLRSSATDLNCCQFFTSARLQELGTRNSDECVEEIAGKKAQFDQLLSGAFKPDVLVATVQVLANICSANFAETVTGILSRTCSVTFLKSLESYLTSLPFESSDDKLANKLYWENKNKFWNNLVIIFGKINKLFPNKARDELMTTLGKIISIITITETNQDYVIDTNAKDSITKLHNDLKDQVIKIEPRNEVQETLSDVMKTENPPQDFRSLSVIPTIEDLADDHPFIRPSKRGDAYDSVEHYLDIQYRLLREDFISPLRDGIKEYLNGPKQYRNSQLRVYKNVTILNSTEADNNPGLMVSFGRLRNVDWRNSKRFLFGSLLCLSRDDFSSILFATVANRDETLLQNGTILIEPCSNTAMTHDHYQSKWAMLESKIYFEPYLVVLNAMRHLNQENFPMKRYLIDADTSAIIPRYLRPKAVEKDDKDEGEVEYKDVELSYKGFSLPIGNYEAWPTSKELKFDASQYEAFKSALSQEFAIIQGPPGTGKTFIALKIIRTLLENKTLWRSKGPIVIVCLTNHALDQFLEGILKCTKSILRIGRRSKSEALSKYTLVERRKIPLSMKMLYRKRCADEVTREKKFAIKDILRRIEVIRTILKYLTTKDAVVPLSLLCIYCDDEELQQLKNYDVLLQSLLNSNDASIETDFAPRHSNVHARIGVQFDPRYRENRSRNDGSNLSSDEPFNGEKLVFLLEAIDMKIHDMQEKIDGYQNPQKKPRYEVFTRRNNPVVSWENTIHDLELQRHRVQRNLAQHPVLNPSQEVPRLNSHWQNYWKWVKISHEKASCELTKLEAEYRQAILEMNEAKQMVDLEVLKNHEIVGFTTTSAARLHASLRALDAPIVLVEEAAEILESHVVCSLTKSCRHVILIGDHKQLRPKVAVHKLGTKYNLNLSLFERMVNIRGTCTQLAHQHRMRPEIARLICPSIYETLHNHKSVLEYPPVMGVEKNVFFLNHKHHEEILDNQDTWINPFEAEFLVAFARHLILQGYKSTEITILCTYTGQLFTLMKERKKYLILKDVRITTVDNFQGEENRIILLSLVRNNEKGNIGFLKEENRVCVALSRAREGLYILGNMENLTVNNNVWPKMKEVLESSNAIGDSLELRCKFHSDRFISVQKADDFNQCPEGGCTQKCNTDLPCGHPCTSICHTLDREHVNFTCEEPCVKKCPEDHPCRLKCFQGCKPCQVIVERQLKCGHTVNIPCETNPETYLCPVKVNAILPHCKHAIEKACHESLDKCRCSQPCEIRLPCGHACDQNCHVRKDPDHLKYVCRKPCSKSNSDCVMEHPCKLQCYEECKPCTVVLNKKRSCGHEHNVKCSENVEDFICYKLIQHYERICGHKATVRCHRKDAPCEDLTMKISPCGHKVLIKCCQTPNSSDCHGKCTRILPCGHPCTARCKDLCVTECKTLVTNTRPGLCGHIISVPCNLKDTDADSPTLLQYCKEPCTEELACDHICKGNCGSCKQGRIHKPCGEKCGNTLLCGHSCDVPCRQECPPCQKPCQMRCKHSKCNKKCGEPCVPCKEPCAAGCRHNRCTKRCYESCFRKPCEEPCRNVLKCGHKCIGFCGDPCPTMCRICDKKELIDEFFLGHEEEPNARFVLLEDCGHCIESRGLLQWISVQTQVRSQSKPIQVKTCPRCKTPISKCMRIMNQIKTDLKDIERVKSKIFGDQRQMQEQQSQLVERIKNMKSSSAAQAFTRMKSILMALDTKVASVTKKMRQQTLNAQAAEAFRIVLDILHEISETYGKIKNSAIKSHARVKVQINWLLASLPCRGQISKQEIADIKRELKRLHYMTVVCLMESEAGLDNTNNSEDQTPYNSVMEMLVCIGKFSETIEDEIVKELEALRTSHHKTIVIRNERKMIVKAMGFSKQGHWYKCPNGHIYSIGECGGAMQVSQCNECGANIGGQSHQLINTNSVASEMDGATRPAWS